MKIPQSNRRQAMQRVEKDLQAESQKSLEQAAHKGEAALAHAVEAGSNVTQAAGKVVDALEHSANAVGQAVAGTAYAAAGGAVKIAEEVGNAVGAALQHTGRAFIAVGNLFRRANNGTQVTTQVVEGKQGGPSLSERLLDKSNNAFGQTAKQLSAAVDDLARSGGHLGDAATNLLGAAEDGLAAAVKLGDAAVIKTAQGAVATARVAVAAVEAGTDGAGALLQSAGKALVGAGNAVNTARANDTSVTG